MPKRDATTHSEYLDDLHAWGRVIGAVVTLRAHLSLETVYLGGRVQFFQIVRPILRNYGFLSQDLEGMWRVIERWYHGDPQFIEYLGFSPNMRRH